MRNRQSSSACKSVPPLYLRAQRESPPLCVIRERSGAFPASHGKDRNRYPLSERHLHCIWYDQLLHRERLATEDGQPLEVLFPGIWNKTGSGPDFTHASLRIGDSRVNGDIEVHVLTGDWGRHGHGSDTAYSNVILHVALHDDAAGRVLKNAKGDRIPVLVLSRFLDRSPEDLAGSLELSEYPHTHTAGMGSCREHIASSTAARVRAVELVRVAGEWRRERKAYRFGLWLASDGFEESLFRGIMETLGYRANRMFFSHLARTMPLGELRARSRAVRSAPAESAAEALLMRRAGFLEGRSPAGAAAEKAPADGETCRYLATLRLLSRGVIADDLFVARVAIRPAHAPERRLAGVARLFFGPGGEGLPHDVLSVLERDGGRAGRVAAASLVKRLVVEARGYWSARSCFGPPALPYRMRLLGVGWARIAVANVVLPLAVAHARRSGNTALERGADGTLSSLAGLPDNAATRLAEYRMFGVAADATRTRTALGRDVRTHFGLLQMCDDFCSRGQEGCAACPAPQVLAHCH